jgi:hypothetical protein
MAERRQLKTKKLTLSYQRSSASVSGQIAFIDHPIPGVSGKYEISKPTEPKPPQLRPQQRGHQPQFKARC